MTKEALILIVNLLIHIYWELIKVPDVDYRPEDNTLISSGQKFLARYDKQS
jgi:hypothetical protein